MTFEQYVQEVERHMEQELPFDVYESWIFLNFRAHLMLPDISVTKPKNIAESLDRDILDREILKAESL